MLLHVVPRVKSSGSRAQVEDVRVHRQAVVLDNAAYVASHAARHGRVIGGLKLVVD